MIKFIRVTLSLDEETRVKLFELHKSSGRSLSQIIRELIQLAHARTFKK